MVTERTERNTKECSVLQQCKETGVIVVCLLLNRGSGTAGLCSAFAAALNVAAAAAAVIRFCENVDMALADSPWGPPAPHLPLFRTYRE